MQFFLDFFGMRCVRHNQHTAPPVNEAHQEREEIQKHSLVKPMRDREKAHLFMCVRYPRGTGVLTVDQTIPIKYI